MNPLQTYFDNTFQNVLLQKQEITLSNLSECAASFWTSAFFKKIKQPVIVIAESFDIAERIVEESTFFLSSDYVSLFPHWDILPYEKASPDKNVVAQRIDTLINILDVKPQVIVTTVSACMQKLLPPDILTSYPFFLEQGKNYSREQFLLKLSEMGYIRVDLVEEKGEFSIRGDIIDLFPLNTENPIRLDFFDETLEEIRTFQIGNQQSIQNIKKVQVTPACEMIFSEEYQQTALHNLKALQINTTPHSYQEAVEHIESKEFFSGIEQWMPLFFKKPATLFDYCTSKPNIIFFEKDNILEKSENYFKEISHEYDLSRSQGEITLNPEQLYLNPNEFKYVLSQYQQINLIPDPTNYTTNLIFTDNSNLSAISKDIEKPLKSRAWNILQQLKQWKQEGAQIGIAARTQTEAMRIQQIYSEMNEEVYIEEDFKPRKDWLFKGKGKKHIRIFTSFLPRGFRVLNQDSNVFLGLISDEEIFGIRKKQRIIKRASLKEFLSSMSHLNVGDYVVHQDYGIGKYEGLQKIEIESTQTDYLVISYKGNDKVYVPVDKFDLVQKYSALESKIPILNKLGDKSWNKTKTKVKKQAEEIAQDLIQIYAQRKAKKGISFSVNDSLMNEFCLQFPYQETPDQEKAIEEVLNDMEKPYPMDRLVCGDVGFGKTEVAMRATCKAALENYQVAVLVPTTLLAQQHYETFCKRFEEFPFNIELLSRFRSPKQIKQTIQNIKDGRVDIVIGTHRMLSKDVDFKKLGLLIIDEEQRFGVRHKETIKKFKLQVDVLTLSATPIPRTLHMSLMGIRDVSIINTPPMDRRAIRTRFLKSSDYVIKEAIERELRRKGQVFFIHNRVETIYKVGDYLQNLLPQVTFRIAHGQMSERELENILHDFMQANFQVLVATTIVESGLDISNANTMIINHADQFGLAQLYQLRGRVGRSNRQAYTYLLTPKDKLISTIARRRLNVLQEINDLGAGFKIASHDLELRGAGDLLGSSQSGHINAVGFDLYTSMIEEEVKKIQHSDSKENSIPIDQSIKFNYGLPAYLPNQYINSQNQRLQVYRQIAGCKTEEELWEARENIEDRFGKLPKVVIDLFYSIQIKLMAKKIYTKQIDITPKQILISFHKEFKPEPQKLIESITLNHGKLLPQEKIIFKDNFDSPENILELLQKLYELIKEQTQQKKS